MKKHPATLAASIAVALAALLSGHATAALSKDEVKSEKDKISAAHKADKEKCAALRDNAKDICNAEAKAKMNVAMAELDAAQHPNDAGAARKVGKTKADADYGVAKEKCEDMKGKEMASCKKDAKAAHKLALSQAKKKA